MPAIKYMKFRQHVSEKTQVDLGAGRVHSSTTNLSCFRGRMSVYTVAFSQYLHSVNLPMNNHLFLSSEAYCVPCFLCHKQVWGKENKWHFYSVRTMGYLLSFDKN